MTDAAFIPFQTQKVPVVPLRQGEERDVVAVRPVVRRDEPLAQSDIVSVTVLDAALGGGEDDAFAGRSPWRQPGSASAGTGWPWCPSAVLVALVILAVAAPLIAHAVGWTPTQQDRAHGLTPDGLPVGPEHAAPAGHRQPRPGHPRAYRLRRPGLAARRASSPPAWRPSSASSSACWRGTPAVPSTPALSRLMDVVLSFPFLLFAIALVSIVGPGLSISVVVIAFFSWAGIGRVVRGQTLSLREKEFVEAARSTGAGSAAHHRRRDPAQPDLTDAGAGDAARPDSDRVRGHAVVPGPRCRAPDPDLGKHDQRLAALLQRRLVVHPRARARHCCSSPWRSTCSATRSAMPWTRPPNGPSPRGRTARDQLPGPADAVRLAGALDHQRRDLRCCSSSHPTTRRRSSPAGLPHRRPSRWCGTGSGWTSRCSRSTGTS